MIIGNELCPVTCLTSVSWDVRMIIGLSNGALSPA